MVKTNNKNRGRKRNNSNNNTHVTTMTTTDGSLIGSPQELADRAIQRLQLARTAVHHIWTEAWTTRGSNNNNVIESTQRSSSSSSSSPQERHTQGVIMDANWWFWNLLLAASPAIIIAVYCQCFVIPRMVREKQEQLQQQQQLLLLNHNPNALTMVDQASKLSWTESLHRLLEYLQHGETKINEQGAKESDRNSTPNKMVETPTTSETVTSSEVLLQQQLAQLKQQLEELETKIQQQPIESSSKQEYSGPAISNIRRRYMEQYQQEQQQQQQQQQRHQLKEPIPSEPGMLQRLITWAQTWWSDYLESLREDVPAESLPSSKTTRDGTSTTGENVIVKPSLQQTTNPVHDSDQPSTVDPSTLPSQQQQQQQKEQPPCHITRSITHPRDQESEHPLWTLWYKPTD
jgi:hypothetical protein